MIALSQTGRCYPAAVPDDIDARSPFTGRLVPWQRWLLALGAVLFAGLGVSAIFLTDNEAGTAVALLLSGVLLIVAVQGTGIHKISAGDKSVELASIRRSMADRVRAVAQDDPKAALQTLDAYQAADPDSQYDAALSAARVDIYERQVAAEQPQPPR
jgi:hypothetical protein